MEIKYGSLTGYRKWGVGISKKTDLPVLLSQPEFTHIWGYDTTEATCVDKHKAPDFDCTCGLYATKTITQFKVGNKVYTGLELRGQTELFGKIIYHEEGYRAQYTRVTTLDKHVMCTTCVLINQRMNIIDLDKEGWGYTVGHYWPRYMVDTIYGAICNECLKKYKEKRLKRLLSRPNLLLNIPASSAPIPLPRIFNTLCELYCDGRRMP